jgi:membrane-associated phospholipid phosphatase
MTIGIFVLPVALLAGALLLWRRGMTSQVAGALSGAGAIPLYIGWLNREGPGSICSPLGNSGESCVDQTSPWPWLVAGLALIVAGVVLFSRLQSPSARQSEQ